MKTKPKKITRSFNSIVSAVALLALSAGSATAQTAKPASPPTGAAFSFAVYGDSRTMMYLPPKEAQKEETIKLMVEMFNLVMPEKIAAEVVQKDVKLTYDPATGELIQIVMPFMTRSEVMTLTVDNGWVTEASVEDVKLLPGVRRVVYRLQGGDWVAREIVKAVQGGRAELVVNSGDIVWWGNQGRTVFDSPYWKHVDQTMFSKLPAPSASMRAAGLDGRWYPSVGNHEVWGDPKIEGVLSAVPYLKKLGVSADQLTYKFDYNGVRFIYLWTGKYDYRAPTSWDATRPTYEEQMKQLRQWLDEAKAAGTKKVFLTFHNPVFSRSGMGAIPEAQNPHKLLASYAKDLDVVVFNGHVHTTELYEVDGVKYLLLGGGGAEQDPILPGRTHIKVPDGYPPDLYWKGASPKEEYNYLLVDVQPGQKTKFTLNRFRPWSAEPFATVELFK
jgi:Calcineurin-like phosphoesterase